MKNFMENNAFTIQDYIYFCCSQFLTCKKLVTERNSVPKIICKTTDTTCCGAYNQLKVIRTSSGDMILMSLS